MNIPETEGQVATEISGKREGIFDEGFLAVIIGLGNVFNFYFHIYMSRNLGPENYSALNSLMSLLFLATIPITTIQTTIAKFAATFCAHHQDAKVRKLFLQCLKRIGAAALILMVITIFGAPFIGDYLNIERNTPIVMSALLLFFMYMMPVFWAVLQGREQFGFLGASIFVGFVAKCGLGILFAIIGWGVGGVLLGVTLSFLFALFVGFWPIREVLAYPPEDDSVEMREIYRFALPVVATLMCLYSFSNLDIPLVRHFYGDSEEGLIRAGYYASASIIGKGFLFLPFGIILALFPKVARKKATGEDARPILIRGLLIEIVLSVGGIIACIVLAPYLARLIARTDAPQLVLLIRFFGIAITPVAVTMILAHYHLADERYGFLWILVPLTVLTFAGIYIYHPTPLTVLMIMGGGSFTTLILVSAYTFMPGKDRKPSAEDADDT